MSHHMKHSISWINNMSVVFYSSLTRFKPTFDKTIFNIIVKILTWYHFWISKMFDEFMEYIHLTVQLAPIQSK